MGLNLPSIILSILKFFSINPNAHLYGVLPVLLMIEPRCTKEVTVELTVPMSTYGKDSPSVTVVIDYEFVFHYCSPCCVMYNVTDFS